MKKWMTWLLVAAMAGMLLTGCSKNDNEKTTEESTADYLTPLPDYTWKGVKVESFVKLGQYDGIEYEPMSTEVKEEQVDELIKELQEASATSKELTEGTVKDGDTINIDYAGRMDGELFDGGSAKNQTIIIGKTSMIPGFIEGLIGEEVGKEIVLDLEFPKDYWKKEYAGKPVEFTIKINYIAGENVLPEVTDAWASTLTGGQYKTVEALRGYLRDSLEAEAEANAEVANQQKVWEQIVANAKVSGYPDGALEYYYVMQLRQMEEMAAYYNMEYEAFVEALDKTMEEMETELRTSAKKYVDNLLTARAMVAALGEVVTDEAYQDFVKELADNYGYDDLDQLVEDYGGAISVEDDLYLNKALDYAMEHAVAK